MGNALRRRRRVGRVVGVCAAGLAVLVGCPAGRADGPPDPKSVWGMADNGDAKGLEARLKAKPDLVHALRFGSTPLWFAVTAGKTDAVRVLLRYGAGKRSGALADALHAALSAGASAETVRVLLEAGEPSRLADQASAEGVSPLAVVRNRMLAGNGPDRTPAQEAAHRTHLASLERTLVDAGGRLDTGLVPEPGDPWLRRWSPDRGKPELGLTGVVKSARSVGRVRKQVELVLSAETVTENQGGRHGKRKIQATPLKPPRTKSLRLGDDALVQDRSGAAARAIKAGDLRVGTRIQVTGTDGGKDKRFAVTRLAVLDAPTGLYGFVPPVGWAGAPSGPWAAGGLALAAVLAVGGAVAFALSRSAARFGGRRP